jgi:hypothetical protein
MADAAGFLAASNARIMSATGLNAAEKLIPEIYKLHGHGKFMGAHGGDDRL